MSNGDNEKQVCVPLLQARGLEPLLWGLLLSIKIQCAKDRAPVTSAGVTV